MLNLQALYRFDNGQSAQNRNRTCTPLRKPDFESSASTNSAIWAKPLKSIQLFLGGDANVFILCLMNNSIS